MNPTNYESISVTWAIVLPTVFFVVLFIIRTFNLMLKLC